FHELTQNQVNMRENTAWKIWQKIAFRFCFLFLGISTIVGWHLIIFFAIGIIVKKRAVDFAGVYHFFSKPLHWFDRNFFHTGYDPKAHDAFPGDNHYGVAFYLTIFVLSIIGTIAWSLLDKKPENYKKLFYWF